ncbi:hypothetical protein ACJ5H2_09780 [Nocardioides sp. R1-1]|uniref:hypothetical protein n=1 Tax=Nocardioides sp. R1-1 TaxID=3383502 RepID=UPI0038D0F4D0
MVLSGCAGDQGRDDAVADVVQRFQSAVDAGDGEGACRLLAPSARETLTQEAQAPCADALLEEDLPPAGDEVEAEVYATAAQVDTGTDTVFLGRYDDGWRVVAAGCAASGDEPYRCAVEGG